MPGPTTLTPQERKAVAGAQEVLNVGNRLFRHPSASATLGRYAEQLRAALQDLDDDLSPYLDATISTLVPAAPPVSSQPLPVLGMTIVVETLIILIILVIVTETTLVVVNSGHPPPKVTLPHVPDDLELIARLTHTILLMAAVDQQTRVKNLRDKMKDCQKNHTDKDCSELAEKFFTTIGTLLKRLEALKHKTGRGDRIARDHMEKAIDDLQKRVDELARALSDCLGCEK